MDEAKWRKRVRGGGKGQYGTYEATQVGIPTAIPAITHLTMETQAMCDLTPAYPSLRSLRPPGEERERELRASSRGKANVQVQESDRARNRE